MSTTLSTVLRKKKPEKISKARHVRQSNGVKENPATLYNSVQPEIASLIRQIKHGYPIGKFERLKEEFGVTSEKLADVASISLATLHRQIGKAVRNRPGSAGKETERSSMVQHSSRTL
jgi:hypothetical protein